MAISAAPKRTIFDDDHQDYRESFRTFLEREVAPHVKEWDADGKPPRELFEKAAGHGFLAMAVPEEYGGPGVDDYRFSCVLAEEATRSGVGIAFGGPMLHTDICMPYI